jgi:hypothetical protein
MTYHPCPNPEFVLTPSELARLRRRADILAEGATRHERGETLAQIGARYGVCKQRVHRMLSDAGIPRRPRPVPDASSASGAGPARASSPTYQRNSA